MEIKIKPEEMEFVGEIVEGFQRSGYLTYLEKREGQLRLRLEQR